MRFIMPAERRFSYGFGAITTDDIEAEIRSRGIYVAQVVPPIPEVVPPIPEVTWKEIPLIIPGNGDLVVIRDPWLSEPPLPVPEVVKRPLDLPPTVIPEPKPESKVVLILIIAIIALAAFTGNKREPPVMARSRAV